MSAAAWENFHKAILELAKSAALKQRLTDAFSRHLQDMPASDMPSQLRGDFESLCKHMTSVSPLRGETAVAATVRKMSLPEADACAARIVALLDALHRAQAMDTGATGIRQAAPTVRVPTLISVNRA